MQARQVREGHWFLGSMMVVACLSRTAGCAHTVNRERDFLLGKSSQLAGIRPLQPSIGGPPVRRTRRVSMLSINVGLKRRALELT